MAAAFCDSLGRAALDMRASSGVPNESSCSFVTFSRCKGSNSWPRARKGFPLVYFRVSCHGCPMETYYIRSIQILHLGFVQADGKRYHQNRLYLPTGNKKNNSARPLQLVVHLWDPPATPKEKQLQMSSSGRQGEVLLNPKGSWPISSEGG